MTATVFISYSHRQAEWVHGRLAPVIRASGAEVILDVADGRAGLSLDVQMRRWGDAAAHVVAVLSPDYLNSSACRLEWKHALARDPGFLNGGILIPVLRETCTPMPPALRGTIAPLYLDLRTDGRGKPDGAVERAWRKLLAVWGGTLGTNVTDWLAALETICRDLAERRHVGLRADPAFQIERFVGQLCIAGATDLAMVNGNNPVTINRVDFLECILQGLGLPATLPKKAPNDIVAFSKKVSTIRGGMVALVNSHMWNKRPGFGDAFDALRYHSLDDRNFTILAHSHVSFGDILPFGRLQSSITLNIIDLPPPRLLL